MKRSQTPPLPPTALIAVLVAGAASCGPAVEPADLVFLGGRIETMDTLLPRAEAVAVRDGRIVLVGDGSAVEALTGPGTEVVQLDGRLLLPGFHDTHVHPVSGGVELGDCDLNPAESRGDLARIVADCVQRAPAGAWIRGGGFQLPLFPDGAPSASLLDSLSPDHPAYLTSADGHSAWVNSIALAVAGVTAATPAPLPDGVIVRDETGRPLGTLRESAMRLVSRHVPIPTAEELAAGLTRSLRMASELGITTLHEASADEAFLQAYAAAERDGSLTARAIVALRVTEGEGTAQVAGLVRLRDAYMGRLVRPVAAKIFLDGVIEGGTAALLEDYLDRPGWRGELNYAPDTLAALVDALDEAGFKVHVHAIGDRAIRTALDAFEARRARDGGAGPRHILAHIQLFHPDDIPRFEALDVVASFQSLWLYADSYITDLTEPRLGPTRSRWLYPLRSVVETGALVVGGSDWSVSSMDPLRAIEVAVTRRDPDLDEGPAWIPEERVDLRTMLRAYTIEAARAAELDGETGSISAGKAADLVVLDQDILDGPPERISDARVEMTLFEGRVVYRR